MIITKNKIILFALIICVSLHYLDKLLTEGINNYFFNITSITMNIIILFCFFYKNNFKKEFSLFKKSFKSLILPISFLTAFLSICLGYLEANIYRYIFPGINLSNFSLSVNDRLISTITTIILMVILAPISEEKVFREILFNFFSKKINTMVAIIIVSLSFGLLHPVVISNFIFSVIMCILYRKTKTIYSSIFAHSISNLTIASFVLWASIQSSYESTTGNINDIVFSISTVGLIGFIVYYFKRQTKMSP